jgi:hypothetical protein
LLILKLFNKHTNDNFFIEIKDGINIDKFAQQNPNFMKTHFLKAITMCIVVFSLTGCSKKDDNSKADPDAKQHNEDISNIKSESDNVNTDINQLLNSLSGFGKTGEMTAVNICGATIDSSQQNAATPTIFINFDGTTVCPNPRRIRSGQVKVELIAGNKWTDQGAKLRVTHTNYKVQFPDLNNHFVTFNGTKYMTNVEGINWLSIYFGTSTAKFRERSDDMMVTFDNGQTASWNFARISEWGIKNGNEIYAIVNGDTTINGKTIDSWGQTRFGTNFITEMIQPWKSGTACGWWNPTQGIYTSVTDGFTITATFGVNQSGNQVSSGCAYGLKLEWELTNSGNSGDIVLKYL